MQLGMKCRDEFIDQLSVDRIYQAGKGKSLGLRAKGPGADPRTERRTRASSQGPSRQNFLGKGGCVFFLVLAFAPVCVCLPSCRGLGSRLGRVRPVPFVVLSFVASPLLLLGVRFSLGAVPKTGIVLEVSPWSRVTDYAVWGRLPGCRGMFWDFGSLFVP